MSSRLGTVAFHWRQGTLPRYATARLLAATGTSTWFTIRQEGYRLRFYPSAMSITLWTDSRERQADEQILRRYLMPGDQVVDIGANIGQLALVASTVVGPAGRVIAVEPHPRTYEYLRGNLALNDVRNVETRPVALGDSHGTIRFSDGRSDDQNAVVDGTHGVTVPITRLDDLALPAGPLALVKMDVEGYEEIVCRGGRQVLARTQCVLFESWETHCRRYGRTSTALTTLLREAGFTIMRPQDDGGLVPVAPAHVSEICENLLAIRDLDQFVARWNRTERGHGTAAIT